MAQPWFCYIARCHDDSLYVGIAQNLEERMKRHNCGAGAEFTARRRPIWSEGSRDSKAARKREKEIKSWSKEKKLRLVASCGLAAKAERAKAGMNYQG